MLMSEKTSSLFAAVSKMQAELTNASKDRQAYGYKYADLAECLSTAKEPLAKNGLAVIQLMGMTTEKESTLITTLTHESGEFIQSETIIPKANLSGSGKGNAVQEMGASITYMRRYAFAAIIGMTQEDTDAANPPANDKRPQAHNSQAQLDKQKAIDAFKRDIAKINEADAVRQFYAENKSAITANKFDAEAVELCKARVAEIEAGAKPATPMMTDAQRKAIMAHYGKTPKPQRINDMIGFIGRNIQSFTELTELEASEFIKAVNETKSATQQMDNTPF